MESKRRGVLDTPLEPVIGLAEGETRWRGMTTVREERSERSNPLSLRGNMDCFAEPVIGRRFAPTRWLAMTTDAAYWIARSSPT